MSVLRLNSLEYEMYLILWDYFKFDRLKQDQRNVAEVMLSSGILGYGVKVKLLRQICAEKGMPIKDAYFQDFVDVGRLRNVLAHDPCNLLEIEAGVMNKAIKVVKDMNSKGALVRKPIAGVLKEFDQKIRSCFVKLVDLGER